MGFYVLARFFRRLFLAGLASYLGLALPGCHSRVQDPSDPRFILAEGDGVQVTQGELQVALKLFLSDEENAQRYGPSKFHILQTLLLDQLVSDKLILSRADILSLQSSDKTEKDIYEQVASRYPVEADFIAKLKESGQTEDDLKKSIHQTALIQKVLAAEAYHQIDPTEQEIEAFYLQHQARFDIPEKVRASRVLVMVDDSMSDEQKAAKRKVIEAARARVLAGEDFAKVAAEVSEDRYSAPQGGDIGFFERGENEDQFDEVAFHLEPGKVSPIFQTPLGFQFIKVTDSVSGGKLSVAESRQIIGDYLKKEKMSQQESAYRQKLISQAHVVYHLIRYAAPDENSSDSTNLTLPLPPPSTPAAH